jgi:hypothetical protein
MNKELKATLILLLACVALIVYTTCEGFITRAEKANSIFQWFSDKGNKYYNDYRQVVPDSNIVEFEEVRRTTGTSDFTLKNIETII